jgi:redox-sensitive bicupin YhaK (pirin superfamily)
MTAASGIVHEEFHSERFARDGGTLEMVQLWVNLPAQEKMSRPHYQGIVRSEIPDVSLPDGAGAARIIAGDFQGTRGPAETFTPVNVWDLQLNPGRSTSLRLPEGHTALLIVQSGAVLVNDNPIKSVELVSFDREGEHVVLHPDSPSRILVLSGEPLNEPVVGQGPFVMNTRDQIHEAIRDYQAGRMGHL